MTQCFSCGTDVFFDNNTLSKYGKKIPLTHDYSGYHKHRCKAKPFNRDTRKAYWQEQNRKAEQEQRRRQREYEQDSHRWSQERKYDVSTRKRIARLTLGISENVTYEEARNAYRNLIMKYHPDRCSDIDATEKATKINLAWEDYIGGL